MFRLLHRKDTNAGNRQRRVEQDARPVSVLPGRNCLDYDETVTLAQSFATG